MKKYITPETAEAIVCNAFAICEPSVGSSDQKNITGDAPGISGGGTQMAPGRKVF